MGTTIGSRILTFARVVLTIGLLAGYYLFAFGIALGALVVAVVLVFLSPYVDVPVLAFPVLAVIALASLVFGARTLFRSRPPVTVERCVSLPREEAEELYRTVDMLAASIGAPSVHEILIFPDARASIMSTGGVLGIGEKRALELGYVALRGLRQGELMTIVAHELGHFAAGDLSLFRFVWSLHDALVHAILAAERARPRRFYGVFRLAPAIVGAMHMAYGKLALRASHAVLRARELAADRQAVAHVGRAAFLRGLAKVRVLGVTFDGFVARELLPLVEAKCWPSDLWRGFDDYAAKVSGRVDELLAKVEPSPYDTHPSYEERVKNAESAPSFDLPEAEGPAFAWLTSPEALWERLGPPAKGLRRVAWSEVADVRSARVLQAAKEASSAYLAVLGKGPWLDVAKRGATTMAQVGSRELALAVEPGLRHASEAVWMAVGPRAIERWFGAIVAMALVEGRGGRFVHVIGEPLQVELDGGLVCPWTLAREAPGSREGIDRLAAALGP
ncbi:MAG: M48 family metalloprotease [Myxococcales bacterium]|nr:M48 family metalloprotease [Myxococcales bacterium]